MKKYLSIAALILVMLITGIVIAAELNNVTSKGVDGDLCFYDKSGNEIFCIEAANRLVTYPSGSGIDVESGASLKIAGTAVTTSAAQLNRAGFRHLNAGTTTAAANTDKSTTGLFYSGSVTVTSGTNRIVAGFSPAFTSTATYNCIVTARAPNPVKNLAWKCSKTSSSSITIATTTSNAVTDTIDYIVVGY